MSLQPCPECGRQISTKAARCPNCGRKSPGAPASEDPVPFLISVAEVRRRKVKCRECGSEVALGSGACSVCGFATPGDTPVRWWLVVTLAVVLGGLGAAAAWKLGFLDRRPVDSSAAADSTVIKSRFTSNSPRFRRDPPRTRSAQFSPACLTPAPVLVYELGRTPSMFQVQLAREVPDPARVTDSLMKRYKLRGAGYDAKRHGVFVWAVSPAVVSALSCESSVSSIEEVSH